MNGLRRQRRTSYARRRVAFARPPASRLQQVRAWLAILLVAIGITVTAAWFGPRFLDWGQYRAAIETVTSAGLGRLVRIAGPIRLSLLPQATLVAGDVTLPDVGDGVSGGGPRGGRPAGGGLAGCIPPPSAGSGGSTRRPASWRRRASLR